jgi:hypothetical protein
LPCLAPVAHCRGCRARQIRRIPPWSVVLTTKLPLLAMSCPPKHHRALGGNRSPRWPPPSLAELLSPMKSSWGLASEHRHRAEHPVHPHVCQVHHAPPRKPPVDLVHLKPSDGTMVKWSPGPLCASPLDAAHFKPRSPRGFVRSRHVSELARSRPSHDLAR